MVFSERIFLPHVHSLFRFFLCVPVSLYLINSCTFFCAVKLCLENVEKLEQTALDRLLTMAAQEKALFAVVCLVRQILLYHLSCSLFIRS